MAETAAQRYARDYGSMSADRKDRELDVQGDKQGTPDGRTERLYVNDANGATAVNKTN